MSSIADALKRAQQERDRLQGRGPEPADAAGEAAARAEPSLASVVLRKNPPEPAPAAEIPQKENLPTTPVAAALKSAPPLPRKPRPEQRQAETIVEDYSSKRKLNLPVGMVVYHDRSGPIAEQYRRMRDALMRENTKHESRVLVVSSSVPGEGKTTSVMNLGLALAEVRANRVLLVDGHLHGVVGRKSLSQLMRVETMKGLAEMLAAPLPVPGTGNLAEALEPYVQPTPWHNLFVLPAGARTSSAAAAELLQGETLRAGLRHLRGGFTWILIDAPAALDLPDASLLAAASDGLLLAVALHHTEHGKVESTVRRLRANGVPPKSLLVTRA